MPGDRFDSEQMFGWIKDQASMGARRAGSAADRQNEDYIEAHLRDFGLEKVRREPIPITHWAAETHSVEIDAGSGFKPVDSFPIPYSAFTAPEGREARLVFADPATLWHRADWKGAIVVTEIGFPDLDVKLLRKFSLGQYDPDGSLDLVKHPATWVRLGWHLYHLAAKRGAEGFIGIVKDQPGGSCHMYAPYGFREKDILDKPIPGFWVGRADASWLRKAAESGHGKARLSLAGIREPGTMHNIVGEIPGSSEGAGGPCRGRSRRPCEATTRRPGRPRIQGWACRGCPSPGSRTGAYMWQLPPGWSFTMPMKPSAPRLAARWYRCHPRRTHVAGCLTRSRLPSGSYWPRLNFLSSFTSRSGKPISVTMIAPFQLARCQSVAGSAKTSRASLPSGAVNAE